MVSTAGTPFYHLVAGKINLCIFSVCLWNEMSFHNYIFLKVLIKELDGLCLYYISSSLSNSAFNSPTSKGSPMTLLY